MTGQTTTAPARVVTGEPGCGRTAFLEGAARAFPAGSAVCVRADPAEGALPLGGLCALLRAVGAAAGPQSAAGNPPAALLLDALHTASARTPLLVCVDDAHLWDAPSRAALGLAARHLRATGRVSLLLSVAGHRPLDPEFAALPVVRIDPLSPAEAAALLDEATGDTVDPAVRDDLVDAADGNPALLLAMVRRLSPAQLRGHRPPPRPPADVGLLTRLAGGCPTGLTAAQESLLLTVAAALADADGEDERVDVRLVPHAVSAAVPLPEPLTLADGRLGFRSDLVRRAVYEGAPPERRRAAHLALARALEGDGARGLRTLLHRARSAAAPPPGTADRLAAAAADPADPAPRGLRCAGYTRAAELAEDGTRRAEWYTAAAEQALLGGRTHRALRLLDAARDSAVPRALRGRTELVRGTALRHDGPVDEARESLLLAARLLTGPAPRLAEAAALAAADAAWAAGDTEGCLHALGRGGDEGTSAAGPGDYGAGLRALLEGDFPAAAVRLRRLVAERRAADDTDGPETSLRAAAAALLLGDLPAACRAGARALAAARAPGSAAALAPAREYLAYAELRAGRHTVARTHAEEGLRAAHRTGQRNTAAHHHAALALAASVEGDPAEVAVHARAALSTARRHGLVQAATLAEWAVARADLGQGRPREAADRLGPLVRPGPRRGHFAVWMSAVPCYVEAAVSAGRDDHGAGEVVEEFARWAGFGADPQAPAQLLRCRALLAPPERADALYRAALDLHDAAGGDFERARTELSYGKWLRRRRRLREARDRLGTALVGFERCGARAWAEQARAELRANGVSPGGGARTTGLSGLTPQQLRIARRVAEGATNREVALALSVSTRTVDYHLRKVFAALGVRSRVELARLVEWAERPPGTTLGGVGGRVDQAEINRAHP